MKRYQIQVRHIGDSEWRYFYSALGRSTERGARREWWFWVNYEWDFTGDKPVFRIWDTMKEVEVEL